jgi:hypothetical protein
VKSQLRPLAATSGDLDVAQAEAAQPKGLERRLLGGEARREVAGRPTSPGREAKLGGSEEAPGESGTPFERPLETLDLDQVDADQRSTPITRP